MSGNSPEAGQTNQTDTRSIHYVAPENTRGTTGSSKRKSVDVWFATFLAEESSALERTLESRAAEFADRSALEYHSGEWNNAKTFKWHEVVPGDKTDKRVYKAHAYTDAKGRPRRRVRTQPYPSGETETFDDRAIIDDEFETWRADRLHEAGRLTEAEKQRLEAERAARREKEARERAEREQLARERAEKQRLEAAQEAARKAETLDAAIKAWHHLPQATNHPYLRRKQLGGYTWHDVRQNGPELWIALRDVTTLEITGIQKITADGEKKMVFGSSKVGSAIFVTGIPNTDASQIVLTEGWGTGGSCALASNGRCPSGLPNSGTGGRHVIAAIDAGNLEVVYHKVHARYPTAKIIIASDDDAGTALGRDRHGRPKGNKGQTAAHNLALMVGCKVAIPTIPGQSGVNADFSDVHAHSGLAEVGRLLDAAQPASAAYLSGATFAHQHNCTLSVNNGRYLNLPDIQPGVTILLAAMGTGKTEAFARWLEQHPDLSVLAISHLRSLTGNLAARLKLANYLEIKVGYEYMANEDEQKRREGWAFCVNSLWRLALRGGVKPVDVLFADEIEQLLRRITSRSDFARKRQCLAVLEFLVRSAKYVIVADAHVGETTLNWIKRLRPHDAPRLVLGTYLPGDGRTTYRHERKGDVRAAARDALKAGKHVYYALNGLERAIEFDGWIGSLKAELPKLRVLLVCSDTSDEEPVKAFFRNPNGESKKYDLIIASPSVSTGVSIDNGHFDVVCGEFSARVGTPNDALQALSRVRNCPELHVWVEARRATKVTDRETIRGAFWKETGDDVDMGSLDPITGAMTVAASYAELYLDVKVAEHKAVNTYARGFWTLVTNDGYTVSDGDAAEDAAEIEQHARDAAKEAKVQAKLAARDLTDDEAKTLKRASTTRTLTRDERDALDRYDLMEFYRLPAETPNDELRDVVEQDRDGELRRQIERLELTSAPDDMVDAKMSEQVERDTLAPDITRYDHRHHAWRKTLEVAGIDLETLEVAAQTYDETTLREQWVKPLEPQWNTYRVSVPSWPDLKYARAQPIKACGGVLRGAFGLSHRRAGLNADGTYKVSVQPLETRRAWIEERKEGETAKLLAAHQKLEDRSPVKASIYRRLSVLETPEQTSVPPLTDPTPVAPPAPVEHPVTSSTAQEAYERLRYAVTHGRLREAPYAAETRADFDRADQGSGIARWSLEARAVNPMVLAELHKATSVEAA